MRTSSFTPPVRATVIVPTYGDAPYIRWALASAQAQTVREIEICVLCDGSPPQMVEMLQGIAANDYRIPGMGVSQGRGLGRSTAPR